MNDKHIESLALRMTYQPKSYKIDCQAAIKKEADECRKECARAVRTSSFGFYVALTLWVVLFFSLISCAAYADGTGKIYKAQPTPKNAEVIRPTTKHGALLPSPTYNLWDSKDRPKYWNGYGVDPSDQNYYHYFEKYPCNYDFMKTEELCKYDASEVKSIPEPSTIILLITGFVALVAWKVKL